MRPRTRSALAVTILLALGAAACGGDDGDEAASGAGDEELTQEEMMEAYADMPLQQLLGMSGDPEEQQEQWAEQERVVQAAIAECMAAEGFEYIPVDTSSSTSFSSDWPGSDLTPREYAEQYGYGISTTYEENMSSAPMPEDMPEDPNMEIIEAMSPGEQEAYYTALYGASPDFDPTAEEQEVEYEGPQGCYGEAYEATNQGGVNAVYSELEDEINDLYERLEADPRIVELEAAWVECMADAGYGFTERFEPYDEINTRMEPLYNAGMGGMTFEDDEAVVSEGAVTESTVFESGVPELTPEQRRILEEVQAYELEVAVADYECSKDDMAVYLEVQRELEQAFVDTYGEQITALVEGGGSAG
jgi:hypothetical protein